MLILGATSDIARAAALAFGLRGWDMHLAGRDAASLEKTAADLAIRTGRAVSFSRFDALKPEEHAGFWAAIADQTEGVFCAVGLLGDEEAARHDPSLADAVLRTNFAGLVPVLSLAADAFERRGKGLIIGVSSVAGDRGRAAN
jgi:short-subunit dehydrogenase